MPDFSQFRPSGSSVGDGKYRYAGLGNVPSAALDIAGPEHWLKAANYVAYAADDHAPLLTTNPQLVRSEWKGEASASASSKGSHRVFHDGAEWVFSAAGAFAIFSRKAALDGSTATSTACPSLAATGRAVVRVPSGASAGRIVALNSSGAAQYMASATEGAWSSGSSGLQADLAWLATKPDGTLMMAARLATINNTSGDTATSADSGATWVNRTPTGLAGATTVTALAWSALLAKFLMAESYGVVSTADGYTFASENAGLGTPGAGCRFAEGATALLVLTHGGTRLFASTGGAFAETTAPPTTFTAVCSDGTDFYATDNALIYRSADDGVTWAVVSRLPAGAASGGGAFSNATTGITLSAAGGALFAISAGGAWVRPAQSMPTLTPDLVGVEQLATPYTHVRIK